MCIVEGDSDDEFVDSDDEQVNANGGDACTRVVTASDRVAASTGARANIASQKGCAHLGKAEQFVNHVANHVAPVAPAVSTVNDRSNDRFMRASMIALGVTKGDLELGDEDESILANSAPSAGAASPGRGRGCGRGRGRGRGRGAANAIDAPALFLNQKSQLSMILTDTKKGPVVREKPNQRPPQRFTVNIPYMGELVNIIIFVPNRNDRDENSKRQRQSRAAAPHNPHPDVAARCYQRLFQQLQDMSEQRNTYILSSDASDCGLAPAASASTSAARRQIVTTNEESAAPTYDKYSMRQLMRVLHQKADFKVRVPVWLEDPAYSDSTLNVRHVAARVRVMFKRASNSQSKTHRGDTESSNSQTTRVPTGNTERAQAAQTYAVQRSLASARAAARRKIHALKKTASIKLQVTDAANVNLFTPCMSLLQATEHGGLMPKPIASVQASIPQPIPASRVVGMMANTSTSHYSLLPMRLGKRGILWEARRLATMELEQFAISRCFGSPSEILHDFCKSVLTLSDAAIDGCYTTMEDVCELVKDVDDELPYDGFWASIVLLSYVLLDHRGRMLVSSTFTDLDVAIVRSVEYFGFSEVRNRVNYEPTRISYINQAVIINPDRLQYMRAAGQSVEPTVAKQLQKKLKSASSTSSTIGPPSPAFDDEDEEPIDGGGDLQNEFEDEDDVETAEEDVFQDDEDVEEAPPPQKRKATAAAPKRNQNKQAKKTGCKMNNHNDPADLLKNWSIFLKDQQHFILYSWLSSTQVTSEVAAQTVMRTQCCDSKAQHDPNLLKECKEYASQIRAQALELLNPNDHGRPSVSSVLSVDLQGMPTISVGFDAPDLCKESKMLHAVEIPSRLQPTLPSQAAGITFLWSKGTCGIAFTESEHLIAQNPSQTTYQLDDLARVDTLRNHHFATQVIEQPTPASLSMQTNLSAGEYKSNRAMLSKHTGCLRSFMVMHTRVANVKTDALLGQKLGAKIEELAQRSINSMAEHFAEVQTLIKPNMLRHRLLTDTMDDMDAEPQTAPCDPYTLGLRAALLLLHHTMGPIVQPGNDVSQKETCYHKIFENNRTELPPLYAAGDINPLPLAMPCDFSMEEHETQDKTSPGVADVAMTASVEFVGHRMRRVVDVIQELAKPRRGDAVHGDFSTIEKAQRMRSARSLLAIGVIQASYITDSAHKLSSVDTSWASRTTRRIINTDVTYNLYLTIDSVMVGYRGNMRSMNRGTPWVQCSGSGVDTGITPPGADAANQDSDGRKHGVIACSEAVANVMYDLMIDHYLVDVQTHHSKRCVASRPNATRGIPRALFRGMAPGLANYDEAMELIKSNYGASNTDMPNLILDLMVNPLSPWSQQVAPKCRPGFGDIASCALPGSQRTMHEDVAKAMYEGMGRQHVPDATLDDRAVGHGTPRLQPPSNCNKDDNYYSTCTEEIAVLFMMFNQLARYANILPGSGDLRDITDPTERHTAATQMASYLRDTINAFILDQSAIDQEDRCEAFKVAASALVCLATVYTSSWGLAQPMLGSWLAKAAPAACREGQCLAELAKRSRERASATPTGGEKGAELQRTYNTLIEPAIEGEWPIITDEDVADAREWWGRFTRETNGAWAYGVEPLLIECLKLDGTHDIGQATIHKHRDLMDRAIMAQYWVQSPDGVQEPDEPFPACDVSSPEMITPYHVNPIFAHANGDQARGGIVSMKFFQVRQVFALLNAADVVPLVQVYRLDGQLTLKLATDRSIYTVDAKARSERTTNATGQDQCALSQGNDDERTVCCALQRRAWDCNILMQLPLFMGVEKPQTATRRSCGAYGTLQDSYETAMGLHEVMLQQSGATNPIGEARKMMGEGLYNASEDGILV